MAERDTFKVQRILDHMEQANLDALVVRLAENILTVTGYFPNVGYSAALVTKDGDITLVTPEQEEKWTHNSWAEHNFIKGMWQIEYDPAPITLKREVTNEIRNQNLTNARVGWDGSFEYIAPNMLAGEPTVPDQAWREMLEDAVSGGEVVDATETLRRIRAVKSARDIEKLRIANEIGGMAYEAWYEAVNTPGTTNAEAAAAAEHACYAKGIGYKGTVFASGWPQCSSGTLLGEWVYYQISTQKPIEEGEEVLMELAVCADGYWADLTRTVVAGEPDERQRELFEVQQHACNVGIEMLKPGASCFEIDERTREAMGEYAKYNPHHSGHGLGVKYHEPYPLISPQMEEDQTIEAGHVVAFEPAIYIKDVGGIRIEDNIVVTEDGPEILSDFPRGLRWD